MKYERPVIVKVDNLAEGVYLSSGDQKRECQSIYMNGTYHTPHPNCVEGATCKYEDLGCRSCPADINYACALQTGEGIQSLSKTGGQFMPIWEYEGHAPSDTYVNTNFNTFNPS